jgi:hypothetical protein
MKKNYPKRVSSFFILGVLKANDNMKYDKVD